MITYLNDFSAIELALDYRLETVVDYSGGETESESFRFSSGFRCEMWEGSFRCMNIKVDCDWFMIEMLRKSMGSVHVSIPVPFD